MTGRQFPLVPRSTRELEVGDFWAVALPSGDFGVQVRDLKRAGTGALTTFIAGVVDWSGSSRPDVEDLLGRRVLAQGMVSTDVFTKGRADILGNSADTVPAPGLTSAFRDFGVGTVTQTWGWKLLPNRVETTLAADRS